MKKHHFLLLVLLTTTIGAFAQDSIRFRDVSLSEAYKMAQAENKPIFLMGFASWCEHCANMKEKVFKKKEVADFFNEHFVCLKQDMEKGEGIALKNRFRIKSYPTFIFLDASGTSLYHSTGERTDTGMITLGKTALDPSKQFPFLKRRFEKDATNSDSCLAYTFALKGAMLDCSEPARKHLATQTDEQLLNATNWKIIANCIMDINSREIQFVLNHKKEYSSIASPLRVERKLINLVDELLYPFVSTKDSAGYFKNRPLAASINYDKVDSMIFKYDLTIYEQLNNWTEYNKVANKSAETFAWNNGPLLKEIANNYAEHITNPKSLIFAVNWIKRALALNEEYNLYITGAKLYQKAGDKKSAADMALKGKDMAAKYGFDHKEADALLNALQN